MVQTSECWNFLSFEGNSMRRNTEFSTFFTLYILVLYISFLTPVLLSLIRYVINVFYAAFQLLICSTVGCDPKCYVFGCALRLLQYI